MKDLNVDKLELKIKLNEFVYEYYRKTILKMNITICIIEVILLFLGIILSLTCDNALKIIGFINILLSIIIWINTSIGSKTMKWSKEVEDELIELIDDLD